MLLECVNELNASDILGDDLFTELFSIEDEVTHTRKKQELEKRADELKVKKAFGELYRSYKKSLKKEVTETDSPSCITKFSGSEPMKCGVWRADDSGIWTLSDKGRVYACYHPIYPKTILVNAETNTCKVELAFRVRGRWKSVYVDKKTVASKSSIVKLADNGIQVTSENAGLLVKYLSDVEALNEELILEKTSTSRLGWIGETFMPYGEEVIFDNEENLFSLFNSIKQVGHRDIWYDCIKQLRQDGRIEVLIYIAASLASVLVEPCGALPFIVDLWGESGKGKTVALMVATSVWADPNEGAYTTDAKATTTAMEIRLNILNSLPMTLDDMAQIKNQYDGDFSDLVYRWCAGKGRDRSNINLGLNKLTSWHNCILTNAEHSLVTETMQGGAVNRIIDIEMGDGYIFGDKGNEVAEAMRNNYGFCGREFVEKIKDLGFETVKEIQKKYVQTIKDIAKAKGESKEEKQILPMSLILTADEIAEEYLFKDGVRLDLNTCCDMLKNQGEVSEHKRAYEYIKETIIANGHRFKNDPEDKLEIWGKYLNDTDVAIIGKFFDNIMKEAGFQPKAFLSWANKNGVVIPSATGNRKAVRFDDGLVKCVVMRMNYDENSEELTDECPFK